MKRVSLTIEQRKAKAAEMIGKKIEAQFARKAISIDEANFRVEFVMSTETVDRHGDIIDQASWILDYFRENPAFFLQHEADKFPAGQWVVETVRLEADPDNIGKMRLVGVAEFATDDKGFLGEDIERAWRHVKRGDLNMVSVGFIPHRIDYDEVRDAFILYDCELLECSLVGIGSNRFALAKGKEDMDDRKNAKDALVESRAFLDNHIKTLEDNKQVIAFTRARDLVNQALRRVEI